MGKDPAPPPPPARRLSPDQIARGLERLRALELAAVFTEAWTPELRADLLAWTRAVRRGEVYRDQLAGMAEAFERLGLSTPTAAAPSSPSGRPR